MEVSNPFVYLEAVDKMLTDHREKVINGEISREKFLTELQNLTIFADNFKEGTESSKKWIYAVVEKHLDALNAEENRV